MAIALVQSVWLDMSGANPRNVTISPTGTGHLIVVMTAEEPSTNLILGVTDDVGNTYIQVPGGQFNLSNEFNGDMWYAVNSIPGATTVSVALTALDDGFIIVSEYSGIAKTNPIDTVAVASTQSGIPTGPVLNISNGESLLLTFVNLTISLPTAVAPPWSEVPNSASVFDLVQIISPGTVGAYQALYVGASQDYASGAVAFLPPSVPGNSSIVTGFGNLTSAG